MNAVAYIVTETLSVLGILHVRNLVAVVGRLRSLLSSQGAPEERVAPLYRHDDRIEPFVVPTPAILYYFRNRGSVRKFHVWAFHAPTLII